MLARKLVVPWLIQRDSISPSPYGLLGAFVTWGAHFFYTEYINISNTIMN